MIKNICVYASSSNDLAEIYYKEAAELGKTIGSEGFNIVYGGSRRGLMYACAGAVKNAELSGLCRRFLLIQNLRTPKIVMNFM